MPVPVRAILFAAFPRPPSSPPSLPPSLSVVSLLCACLVPSVVSSLTLSQAYTHVYFSIQVFIAGLSLSFDIYIRNRGI